MKIIYRKDYFQRILYLIKINDYLLPVYKSSGLNGGRVGRILPFSGLNLDDRYDPLGYIYKEMFYKGKIINHKKQLDMFPGVVEKMLEIERLVKEDTYCSIQDYDYSTVKAIYDEIMPIIQSAFDEEKLYDLGY
ncbi:MAG: hypothetical protein WC136_08360 [Sphaerochaeta sp.]|jgi:hypothetical protein